MFTMHESFKVFGADRQPALIEVERSSNFPHLHSRVASGGYALSCAGNRHLLACPDLREFSLKLEWYVTYSTIHPAELEVVFHYDPVNRCGMEIAFRQKNEESEVQLFRINGIERIPASDIVLLRKAAIHDNTRYCLEVHVDSECVRGTFADEEYMIRAELFGQGRIGFARRNFIGEWVLCDAMLSSPDPIEDETIIPEKRVLLPQDDGGTIPYEFAWTVVCRGCRRYLEYELSGGPQNRHKYYPPLKKSGQYSGEIDYFRNPYVRVYTASRPEGITAYLKNGRLATADPALQWKAVLSDFLDISQFPVKGTLPLPDDKISDIAFGYASFRAKGYNMQSAQNAEYLYTLDGEYRGRNLLLPHCELYSPPDKEAVRRIPTDCFDYEAVKLHFQRNHYFSETENIEFTLKPVCMGEAKWLSYTCSIQDIFGDVIEDIEPEISTIGAYVNHAPMPVGLYRIEYRVFRGEQCAETVNHVFEVFDSAGKRCAPIESGLPFLYSTPNEQRYLDRDAFDPWNPMPSCDAEHYFACCCMTGVYGEQKRIWEIIPLFGRKWYVWLTNRTMNDTVPENHLDLVRNADYIITDFARRSYNLRSDYWRSELYTGHLRETLDDFLKENSQFKDALDWYTKDTEITAPRLLEFLRICGDDWFHYATERQVQIIEEENRHIASINPYVKRACYGPYSIYVMPNASYYSCKRFGYPIDRRISDVVFTGFAQFEDYPSSCAYQTDRSAFALMTLGLHVPSLRIYPEQYRSADGGCIDGAVKFASPPMGARTVPDYFQLTHAFEFVYNTPAFTDKGFTYWNDYGLMKRDFTAHELDVFARGWKSAVRYQPSRPEKGAAFVAEFGPGDDRFEMDIFSEKWVNAYNISEENMGYIYETLRESGIPGGFACKWKEVLRLTPELTDIIVLPSLSGASPEVIEHLRKLNHEGVSLFACGDVCGMEDDFGVVPQMYAGIVCTLTAENESENIPPYEAEFRYKEKSAVSVLKADKVSALLLRERDRERASTVLLNAAVSMLGHNSFTDNVSYGRECISKLLRKTVRKLLRKVTSQNIVGDNCGLTVFRDSCGRKMLLAVDYSPYDGSDPYTHTTVNTVRMTAPVRDVVPVTGVTVNRYRDRDGVHAFEFSLRMHESALFEVLD